eukprot:TRINITY_DN4321_c0_g1_i1.p1 TRINITY_DN4321_c0_g1~~TRINITY_DN4321_c0_g1_i1.p1  ORF type:complete len:350 (+),score=44.01 TRINITY_DN4321_c0_g1_i1:37-1086(+)
MTAPDDMWESSIKKLLKRRKTTGGGVTYQVQWACGEKGWVTEEDLEEEGYHWMMSSFETTRRASSTKKKEEHNEEKKKPSQPLWVTRPYVPIPPPTAQPVVPTSRCTWNHRTGYWNPPQATWESVFYKKKPKAKKTIKPCARKTKEKQAKASARAAAFVERLYTVSTSAFMSPSLLGSPLGLFPNFITEVVERFKRSSLSATNIFNVLKKDRLQAFERQLCDGDTVKMVFHGTPTAENISGIVASGLRIPNVGNNPIKMLNGAAYGPGVYTAETPGMPSSYSLSQKAMFVCAGVRPTVVRGDVNVYGVSHSVIPIAIVTYVNAGTKYQESVPVFHSSLLNFAPPFSDDN